jgi:hypothetical protein
LQNKLPAVRWVGGPEIEVLSPDTLFMFSWLPLLQMEGLFRGLKICPRRNLDGQESFEN